MSRLELRGPVVHKLVHRSKTCYPYNYMSKRSITLSTGLKRSKTWRITGVLRGCLADSLGKSTIKLQLESSPSPPPRLRHPPVLLLLVHPLHHHLEEGRQQRKTCWDITSWWARGITAINVTSEFWNLAQKFLTRIKNMKYGIGNPNVFSCPEQLNRWPCHWLRTFTFDITEWP